MIQTFLWHELHTEKTHFAGIRLSGKGSTPPAYSSASLLEREICSRNTSMLLGSKQGYDNTHPVLEQVLPSFQRICNRKKPWGQVSSDQSSPLISCDLPTNWALHLYSHPADQRVIYLYMSLMECSAGLHTGTVVTPEAIKKLRR